MENVLNSFPVFLLVFTRVSAFFVTMPLLSYRTLPASYRIGFAFFLSFIMYSTISIETMEITGNYLLLIFKEASVGLLLGFIAYMMLSAVQIAGGFIDFQMGFAIANVIDPQTGAQSPLIGQYLYMFALLFLLAVNGHHLILDGVYYSYQFIPIDQLFLPFGDSNMIEYVIQSFSLMFMIAFQMAIPVIASLFLVDVALGIVARTVPQLNIFVVGFPIKIAVSFLIIFIVLAVMFGVIQHIFETMLHVMRTVMEFMGGLR
ncbi:flagellar biosynthetic protein FliR [Bacillus sp. FJAT-50079]|uniref:flagellar biosynthetic protein FliR n=1 Tax=Bacillus sp. FJAT-50079 TaxID=2833577 RepID=UPI001BC8F569|nr:flagellar biosynthetic protein FliR [Bacillus sp. FJAT-50079]MBS4207609.1 flagellar type III secretion system protein FliR [Bacillus sp. FJAT-50079]